MSYSINRELRNKLITDILPQSKIFVISPARLDVKKDNKFNDYKQILLEDGLSAQQIINLAYREGFKGILQNSLQNLEDKLTFLKKIESHQEHFFDETCFVLEKAESRHQIIFDSTTDRKKIINLVFSRLNLDPYSARQIRLRNCLEELLMNSQIDAKNLSKDQVDKKNTLVIEKNQQLIALSTYDHYGTLEYDKFLSRIESCLNLGISQAMELRAQKGAGVGSTIIYDCCESLFLGSKQGKKTRVSVTIPLNLSDKKMNEIQKSLFLI